MNQELTMHYEKEKGKLQDEYDLKVQELNEDYEKLILDYEDKKNALQNEYDSKVKDLDKDYEDKENVLQSEYDSKIQELNTNYRKLILYYEDKKENLENEYDLKTQELTKNYEEVISYYKIGLKNIENELEQINSNCIIKYYSFSDYDGITSEDCQNELSILKQKEKELRKDNEDIALAWYFNSNKRTEQNIIRKILRTFNAECDNISLNITTKNIDKARKKIENSFETLNKLYSDSGISLTTDLLELKLEQITTIYTYELKKQQEKEIQKAIKEQMTEEAKAQKEIEDAKKKVEKDLQQHLGEINRMMKYIQKTQIDAEKQLYIDKIKELEEKIKVLEANKEVITEREANAKAGFVYIISNIGSFGENIYKIGMTRRLEPMDRIKELSSASVPFEFDVHAMIFSSNAPELETTLHKYFANYAVNKINPRKEFYNIDIDEIEKVVKENYNDTVQFTKIPIATEYRQSINLS